MEYEKNKLVGGNMATLPKLIIGDLISEIPIVQGGMGVGVSMSKLSAAVANEGAIGVISSVGLGEMDEYKNMNNKIYSAGALRKEIRKAKKMSDGVIGVNIMLALTDFYDHLKVAFEEGIDIIFLGAGLPLKAFKGIDLEILKTTKTKLAPIISSARAIRIIFNSWLKNYGIIPDAIVVEGPKAGGHLGFKLSQIDDPEFQLEKLIPPVVEAVRKYEIEHNKKIPVIAGGGIYDGSDIKKFIEMGASGVQMGTRFVATHECDADIKFKELYIKASKDDIKIIKSPVGLPGRAIFNDFLANVSNGIRQPFACKWQCLKTCDIKTTLYCIAKALTKAKIGEFVEGFAFAGANDYRIKEIVSVKELINSLIKEYETA